LIEIGGELGIGAARIRVNGAIGEDKGINLIIGGKGGRDAMWQAFAALRDELPLGQPRARSPVSPVV
jgi:hypothetical protein